MQNSVILFISDILSMSAYNIVAYKILTVLDDNHYHASQRTVIQQGKVTAKNGRSSTQTVLPFKTKPMVAY